MILMSQESNVMASIKVKYFDFEGVAEKVRLALAVCNKEYEDIRIIYFGKVTVNELCNIKNLKI